MPSWSLWLRCIAKAVVARGARALIDRIPIVNILSDIAGSALEHMKEAQLQDRLEVVLAEVAQASQTEVNAAAVVIAQEVVEEADQDVSPDALSAVKGHVAAYLAQVPAVVRQSLRRPADPTGHTVPAGFKISRPEDLLPFLPPRLPRFQPGDSPPCIGSWRLVELLGVGGFGEVWKAQHKSFPEKQAAIKFCLNPELQAELLNHEGQTVEQARKAGCHKNIVPLEDANLECDPPWLRYEYVRGGDLVGLVEAVKGIKATEVVRELAEIIGSCHRLHPPVVHRDLKPANILVEDQPQGGYRLRVTDFGIGGSISPKPAGGSPSLPSTPGINALPTILQRSHTPVYASPQQQGGKPPDPRDDVYSLAVIWYQLLRGDLTQQPPNSSSWKKELVGERVLTEEMANLLELSWEHNPEARPADAAVLADRIANIQQTPSTLGLPGEFVNSLEMKLVLVPKGKFWMGGGGGTPGEKRVHIKEDFYIGAFPVTQGEWQALMGNNPCAFSRDGTDRARVKDISDGDLKRFPVETVSWEDAQVFLRKLNDLEGNSDWVYRLPTEEEWEYACRGGASSKRECSFHFYFTRPTNNLSATEANFNGDCPVGNAPKGKYLDRPTVVGSYLPNALGVHDMHGNLFEWCQSWFIPCSGRVYRGGCWHSKGSDCRAANRFEGRPLFRSNTLGFRLARVPSAQRSKRQ